MREDSAGDGMAEEGGVDETDEDSEDSLMLTISGNYAHWHFQWCSSYSI